MFPDLFTATHSSETSHPAHFEFFTRYVRLCFSAGMCQMCVRGRQACER